MPHRSTPAQQLYPARAAMLRRTADKLELEIARRRRTADELDRKWADYCHRQQARKRAS
jgi:hypothetical protein